MKDITTTSDYIHVWDEETEVKIPIDDFESWVEKNDRNEWVYDTLGFNGHEQTSGRYPFEIYLEIIDLTHELNEFLKWKKKERN